jgi:hypothetical protein
LRGNTTEGAIVDGQDISNRFDYHQPKTPDRVLAHETIREVLRQAAIGVNAYCPDGREKSLAITKLEEAMFWANAAIARQP